MLVYLADLRHRTLTLTPEAMPLSIGYLAAYAAKILGAEVQVKLFAYPENLMEELQRAKPDVLAMANYCWNYALHCRVLRYARGLHPGLLTVMGGPNISLDPEGEERRLRQTPCLDMYILNEGEQAFAGVLTRYLDVGLQKSRLFQEPLPSSIFVAPDSGQVVRGTPIPRMRQLDEIPSPYLTGLMDPFFDGAFCPMIQTNRGCPFSCTFCVEGVGYMTKVNKISPSRVREELQYIVERAGLGHALFISDSNFGMFSGDIETARAIRGVQEQRGWPKFVFATTGKNNKEAILSVLEVLGGSMMMTNSVQSMDATVLANIKRSNIKLETYAAVQQGVRARNLQSYTEVIVGLPGETKESLFRGVCELLDSGTHHITLYQLMLLEGTELNLKEQRERHGLKTRFRALARNLGIYADEPVFELEEVVFSTNTLSVEDYLECRKLQLILEIYHREEFFKELLEYLKVQDIPISAFVMALLEDLPHAPTEVKKLFDDYVTEAGEELFDSPEEAYRALAQNYEKLVSMEMGGNLLQKYSVLAWFRILGPVLDYGLGRARALVLRARDGEDGAATSVEQELCSMRQYLLATIINVLDLDEQFQDRLILLEYDIEAWKAGGYQMRLSEFYQHAGMSDHAGSRHGRQYIFHIPQAHARYLKDKLRDHSSIQAVGKQISRLAMRDLRREVKIQPEAR